MVSFWTQIFWTKDSQNVYGSLQALFIPIIWQSLVDMHLLTSVCKAWQRIKMQHLQRGGKNEAPILAIWTKVHEILRECRVPLVVPELFSNCPYHFLI